MIFFIFIYFFIMIVSFKNEGRNHYGRIKKIFETSTRLKSWDSRTSRKGKYLKRTRASLQQANPCRYSPRVADGRSSRHGLSLRFAWLSSSLRTELSRCHRPEACALYLQPKEWFLPPCGRINMFSGKRWFTGYSGRICRLFDFSLRF